MGGVCYSKPAFQYPNVFCSAGTVILEVLNSQENVTEEDTWLTDVFFCFRSIIPQPLTNNVTFRLSVSKDTTSTDGEFHFQVSSDVIIPFGFSGVFLECLGIVVVGDTVVEKNEVIVYDIVPLSLRDVVHFPGASDSLVINVQDNDCEIQFDLM